MGIGSLRGRDDAVGRVGRLLDDATEGLGRVVLVTGEAGIGKTALAREAVRLAHQRGMDVAWGACLDGDLASPFAPWLDVLGADGVAEVASAAASPGGVDPQEAEWRRRLAFHGVVDRLRSRAEASGLLVALDDLQWADVPSQLLLRYVAAHLTMARVVVLGCCRDTDLDPSRLLGTVATGVERMALEGLEAVAVRDLVADLTGERIEAGAAARLRGVTGGNPFFVTQVARLSVDRAGRLDELAVPSEVEAVLSRRLARLDERTVRLLRAAAVLGEQLDATVAAEITGAPRPDVIEAFRRAERARILQRGDDLGVRWTFVHALFRQVCTAGLDVRARMELHRLAADALDERGAGPAAVAHHLHRADLPPDDPRLARTELAAGTLAMERLAWEDAAVHFPRAAAATPPGAEHAELRARALLGMGDALLRTGDAHGAGVAFEGAAAVARERSWPDVLAHAALGFGAGFGGFEVRVLDQRQIDLLEEAARALPGDSPLRPWVLARLSVALSFVGSSERRLALADEAVALARAGDEPAALASALASRCDAVAGPDHVADRLAAATEIVALARRAGDRSLELLGRRLRLVALTELGRMVEVDDEIAAFDRVATLQGDPLYGFYVPLWRGMRALTRGDLGEAQRWADEAAALGGRAGSGNATVLSECVWWVALVEERSPAAPARFRRTAETHPELVGPDGLPMLSWVHAMVGDEAEARRLLAEIRADGLDRIPREDAEWLPAMTQLADVAVILGDRELAAELAGLLAPHAGLCIVEGICAALRGSVARPLARLAALLGDRPAALAALETAGPLDRAVGALPAAHFRYATAWVLHLLGDRGDRARVVEEARRAAAEYEAMGLESLAGEAAALAGEAAGPVPASAPDRRPEGTLWREGDVWALTWEGTTTRVRHSKGIADLAILLARAGAEVHVRELEPEVGAAAPVRPGGEPLLDRQAAADYRRRLGELEADLAEADADADIERAARLRAERDFLVSELSAAFGLGGRARPGSGDVDERLRKAVGARVRDALRRLDQTHPAAARHLRHSLRTGLWCAYSPERPAVWRVGGE